MVDAVAPSTPSLRTIHSAQALAALLGIDYGKTLSFILHRIPPQNRYVEFDIPKKSGGTRRISRPKYFLLAIQKRLLPFLNELYLPPPCVHGHVIGRSAKSNAQFHVSRRINVNIDLTEFFPSIHFKRIVGILKSQRYGLNHTVATTIAQICCHEGRLPVGAPTSGVLSNMVCGPLDGDLLRLAKDHNLRYSRYVDDITFSATNPAGLRTALGISLDGAHILRDVAVMDANFNNLVEQHGFQLNPRKFWVTTKNVRQRVTGLIVNKKLNVPIEFYRNLRATLSAIEKYGPVAAQEYYEQKFKKGGGASLEENVLGRLSYLGQISNYDNRYSRLAERASFQYPSRTIKNPALDREKAVYHLTEIVSGDEGTTFHIGNGVFVTSAHTFNEHSEPKVARLMCPFHYPTPFVATVVYFDYETDLAILQAPTIIAEQSRPFIVMGARNLVKGDTVTALGFPQYNPGNTCSHIRAKVTAKRMHSTTARYAVDSPFPHGISGGPVLDESGVCTGIVYSGAALGQPDAPMGTTFTSYGTIASSLSPYLVGGD